jgi:molybdopterin molybdotransferase
MEAYTVLSVEEAQERILSAFHPLEAERVDLFQSLGRVLAEDIQADMNIPPLDNSAMDGYAVRASDTVSASIDHPVQLKVIYDLAAGYVTDLRVAPGTAIRIMTGAPIPGGADAVVPFEETDESQGNRPPGPAFRDRVQVLKATRKGANIRPAGEDVHLGETVLTKGSVIRPAEVGLLASVGRPSVLVHRRPRVAILATGDELVGVDQVPGPGQIRNSNNYTVAAAVLRYGGIPLMLGIARDNVTDLTAKIQAGLAEQPDLFITSGGVSMGDFDVVKNVLAAEGEIDFWRVRMKPGKPLAFGKLHGVPHLGLPGNPVSSLVSFELFARPALLLMQGRTRLDKPTVEATMLDGVRHKDDRRHYMRVIVEQQGNEYVARLTGEQGSGILSSVAKANGLAIAPEEMSSVAAGTRLQVMLLDA